MSKKLMTLLATAGVAMSVASFNASAQGYWTNPASGATWKNGYGQCWKTTYFTPSMATAECDPDLMPKKPAPNTCKASKLNCSICMPTRP